MAGPAPRASLVIPAHDESAVLGDLLRELARADPGELETVVVCNGCTDDTARVAATFPGVTVVEVAEASKIAALRAGDATATVLPRVYLDADVGITLDALRAVVAALRAGAPSAAPVPTFDTRGCGVASRAYFAVFSRLGYARHHVLGSGVYGLSAAGRARFGTFPPVVADDGFVYSLFAEHERVNPPGATFRVRPPRTLRALYRRRVRIVVGNRQLAARGSTLRPPAPSWRQVVRAEPRLVAAGAVYAAVNAAAVLRARRLLRAGSVGGWNRDDTSRAPAPALRGGRPA
ncbi:MULTISPECIES: glycosyltransferase [unclassified Isoptericola]|uniref:glycosyltransferase n=1 Tax=unclassified Isoptericola TaxID=2623355 RepID=UPI003653EFA9